MADDVVVLYDLASTRGRCFSPAVWRIRLLLNYKRVPYRTSFLELPDNCANHRASVSHHRVEYRPCPLVIGPPAPV